MPRKIPPQREWRDFYSERLSERLYDQQLEEATVGTMLTNPEVLPDAETLKSSDIFWTPCRTVFEVIMSLYAAQKPIDLVNVKAELVARDVMKLLGDESYLVHLMEQGGVVAAFPGYVKRVKDLASMRRLAAAHLDCLTQILTPGTSYADALAVTNTKISEIVGTGVPERAVPAGEAAQKVVEAVERKDPPRAIQTGFPSIDQFIGGWNPGFLYVIAGRPSMGKTSLAVSAFCRAVVPAYLVSLEMSGDTIAEQMLANMAMVNNEQIRNRAVDDATLKKLKTAAEQLGAKTLIVDAPPSCGIDDLRLRCRHLKMSKGIGLLIVDYLQKMRGPSSAQNREQEIAAISSGLKAIAKEMDIPVVALASLNRGTEIRADRRPQMSDLRESGAIESDADVVMLLYREEYYHPGEQVGVAEIIVAKNRTGRTGTCRLRFHKEFSRFEELHG